MAHPDVIAKFNQLKNNGLLTRRTKLVGNGTPIIGPDGNSGVFYTFQNGSVAIYWSMNTGAWEIHGLIKNKYDRLKIPQSGSAVEQTGVLGFPTSDESPHGMNKGKFNTFEFGSISWKSNTNEAFAVFKSVPNAWARQGLEAGVYGFPISDTVVLPCNGAFNNFEGGTIYASKALGEKFQLGKCVLVTNCAPIPIRARFYNPSDRKLDLVLTLSNGIKTIPVTHTELFPVPANLNSVKVCINGNTPRLGLPSNVAVLNPGNNFVFKTDERVKISNKTAQAVNLKITNTSDPLQIVHHSCNLGPMGNGNHPIAPDYIVFELRDEMDSIKLYFDDIYELSTTRGGEVSHTIDRTRFRVISNSAQTRTIRFYNIGDNWRAGTLIGSTNVVITPRSTTLVRLPTGRTEIQITIDNASPQVVKYGQTITIS